MIDLAYWMGMVLIALEVCFRAISGSLSFVSRNLIEGACVVPLAPAIMTMSGSIFLPWAMILLISGWYFWILLSIVTCENLSLECVNKINCIVKLLFGLVGGLLW